MKYKSIAKILASFAGCICIMASYFPVSASVCEFRTGDDGKHYWYEDGVIQGTYDDRIGVLGDGTIRGREIYDPVSGEWYWLDSVYGGAKAVGKEVWIPYIYQDELIMSSDGPGRIANGLDDDAKIRELAQASINSEADMSAQVEAAIKNRTGKWVRYDENGAMLKGWVRIEGALAECYPDQAGNIYYYDRKTGLMAKGYVIIEGVQYHFDETTGVLDSGKQISLIPNSEGYISLGSYEQDGNPENGKEPIEWIVLDENEKGTLLISRYVLDCIPYNNDNAESTWETCSLRSWLNNDFYNDSFDDAEKNLVLTTHVLNSCNAYFGTTGGNDTEDKVFCLSNDEILKYFRFNYYNDSVMSGYCQSLITPASQYAHNTGLTTDTISSGTYEHSLKNYGYTSDCIGTSGAVWWLRTPCDNLNSVCCVGDWGVTGAGGGIGSNSEETGIRPAIYIKR